MYTGVCAHLHQLRKIVSQLIITAALDPAHSNLSHFCVSKPEVKKGLFTQCCFQLNLKLFMHFGTTKC